MSISSCEYYHTPSILYYNIPNILYYNILESKCQGKIKTKTGRDIKTTRTYSASNQEPKKDENKDSKNIKVDFKIFENKR